MFSKRSLSSAVPLILLFALLASSCKKQLTLEEQADMAARDATRKLCPTPFVNFIRTDSIVFNRAKHHFQYYCTISDSVHITEENKDAIANIFSSSVAGSTAMKQYIEAGFHIRYICTMESNPEEVILEVGN